jgi:hypothetical protein
VINFDDLKDMSDEQKNVEKRINRQKVQADIRALNNEFSVCRYDPEDDLTVIQKKILNRIDLELAHKNPTAKVHVYLDTFGKYNLDYIGGAVKISKACEDKETCFKKLKGFIQSIQVMPI